MSYAINLHHLIQTHAGAISEVTQTFHQQYKKTIDYCIWQQVCYKHGNNKTNTYPELSPQEARDIAGGGMFIASLVKDGSGIATQVLRHTAKTNINLQKGLDKHVDTGDLTKKVETGAGSTATKLDDLYKSEVIFLDKTSAIGHLEDTVFYKEGNKFFKGSKAITKDFRVTKLENNNLELSFFDPAQTPGYGKKYILEVDQYGNKVSHYRQTIDPSGRILNTKLTGNGG